MKYIVVIGVKSLVSIYNYIQSSSQETLFFFAVVSEFGVLLNTIPEFDSME